MMGFNCPGCGAKLSGRSLHLFGDGYHAKIVCTNCRSTFEASHNRRASAIYLLMALPATVFLIHLTMESIKPDAIAPSQSFVYFATIAPTLLIGLQVNRMLAWCLSWSLVSKVKIADIPLARRVKEPKRSIFGSLFSRTCPCCDSGGLRAQPPGSNPFQIYLRPRLAIHNGKLIFISSTLYCEFCRSAFSVGSPGSDIKTKEFAVVILATLAVCGWIGLFLGPSRFLGYAMGAPIAILLVSPIRRVISVFVGLYKLETSIRKREPERATTYSLARVEGTAVHCVSCAQTFDASGKIGNPLYDYDLDPATGHTLKCPNCGKVQRVL